MPQNKHGYLMFAIMILLHIILYMMWHFLFKYLIQIITLYLNFFVFLKKKAFYLFIYSDFL